MEMSTGVSLLRTAQSLLTGRTITFPYFKNASLHFFSNCIIQGDEDSAKPVVDSGHLRYRKFVSDTILSQNSNATLFYFDNIFVRTNALGRLVRLNESSFS